MKLKGNFFVALRSAEKTSAKKSNSNSDVNYSTGTYILALAKKMNMRVPEELNILTLQQFYNMVDVFFGTTEEESNVREATQDDIDRYMG